MIEAIPIYAVGADTRVTHRTASAPSFRWHVSCYSLVGGLLRCQYWAQEWPRYRLTVTV